MSFRTRAAASLLPFAALALALLSGTEAAWAAPREFTINDKDGRDLVSFTSDAPLELINGHTSKIVGAITIDDSLDLTKPVKCSFDVDLASIDTGIALRNEHMRSEKFLNTDKFPKATFVVKKLLNPPAKLTPGAKVKINAQGDFSLHGKTVSKTIPVEITYFSHCAATEQKRKGCDLIQLKATFPVPFKDHSITRPEIVFQKLADTVIVTVSATAYNQIAGTGGKDSGSATGNKAK